MTKEELLKCYSTANLFNYTRDERRCHMGNAPKLAEITAKYGRKTTHEVVGDLLDGMFYFISTKRDSYTARRQQFIVAMERVANELRITEFMLFCSRVMCGYYGKFYNNVEPLDLLVPLHSFINESSEYVNREEARLAQIELDAIRDAREKECCSKEESTARIVSIINRIKFREV